MHILIINISYTLRKRNISVNIKKITAIKHYTTTYFRDKTVWITGASSGIGKEIAIQLESLVHKLILTSRNKEKLVELASTLSCETEVIACDLADEFAINEMIQKNDSILNKVNYVFLNAGISQRSLVRNTKLEVVRKVMELNFFSNVNLSKYLLPYIKRNEGKIIVISSVAGKFGVPYRSVYSASKHALHGFYEALRIEENLNVCLVCPGFIHTDISRHAIVGDGSSYGIMDEGQENGMPVDKAVSKILKGIAKGKNEIYVGGFKETKLGVFMHNNFPSLFLKIIKKSKVK